jgi:hypothetical protein
MPERKRPNYIVGHGHIVGHIRKRFFNVRFPIIYTEDPKQCAERQKYGAG